MQYFLKQHYLLYLTLLLTVHANGQYIQSESCIGGTGNELIYPKYIGINGADFNFKLNDNGSIYFLFSNSADGDFAPNKGYNDLVAFKINSNGELAFAKNFGNAYYEDDFIVKQSKDASRFFILLESHSNDSVNVNGYIGDVTIQYSLMCIDNNGSILWNKILYNAVNHIDNYSFSNYPNWVNLFIDHSDNCIVQYNKLAISSNGRSYYNDSIIYAKIDRNGNTVWNKQITPFQIYNNSDSSFQIDTFYVGTTTFRNDFTETNNKYILSANYSRYNPFQSRNIVYTLDKSDASIASILIDSAFGFQSIGIRNEFITYGNFNKFLEDSDNIYSNFHFRKYDEQLNKIYENELRYNIPFEYVHGWPSSYSKTTSCNPVPYFNNDSTKIWFSTDINTVSIYVYYYPIGYEVETKTYAYILNPENGVITQTVDLNKRKFNSLQKKVKDVFYYYSYDTINYPIPTADSATITAYNFDISELRAYNVNTDVPEFYLLNSICNIENSMVLVNYNNSRFGFKVLDTLFNVVMQGLVDTASYTPDYFYNASTKYNINILDTNRYCVLQSITLDTISGCYPNTDNIVFSTFSKNNVISSVKNNTTSDFLFIVPNPNKGNFTVDFSSKGNYPITVSLFDITGKIVYQITLQHNNQTLLQISDATLATGMYNIQISSSKDFWNKKVLITK
jgi:hypothetical protein